MSVIADLRRACFGTDCNDAFDDSCQHVMIEGHAGPVAAYRYAVMAPEAAAAGYTGQSYGLGPMRSLSGPVLELGRFCIAPGQGDPDILRLAWTELTRIVDAQGVAMMFGCASFEGTDPARYRNAFAWLAARHLAPAARRPERKAAQTVPLQAGPYDPKLARAELPPLLRTYLTMGGWISDHAVVDPEMNTLHVFTGVEIAAIPPARKRLLRALV